MQRASSAALFEGHAAGIGSDWDGMGLLGRRGGECNQWLVRNRSGIYHWVTTIIVLASLTSKRSHGRPIPFDHTGHSTLTAEAVS